MVSLYFFSVELCLKQPVARVYVAEAFMFKPTPMI